jgi:DNA-binding NtrC family response regulator
MERLFNVSRRLAAESDPSRLLEAALESMTAFIDADQGFVLLREDGGRPRVRAAFNLDRETMRSDRFKPLRQIADQALRRGEPFLSAALNLDSRVTPADSLIDAARSVIAIPMRARQSVVGVVYAERYHDGTGAFGVGDLRVLQSFADLVAELHASRQKTGRLREELATVRHANQQLERVAASLNEEVAAKSIELAQYERDLDSKNRALADKFAMGQLVGRTPAMLRVFETIERIASYPVPVVLTGEPGTGKAAVARALHHRGDRREAPFKSINCAAVPAHLIESELFGYGPGAIEGAPHGQSGLLTDARTGTVLIKQIDALPPKVQARLSQAMQERLIRPVGDGDPAAFQARLVVTTREPFSSILDGHFNEELFHQLSVIEIGLPALRERLDDIPLLARHFLARQAAELGLPDRAFSAHAMQLLMRFNWPGNVRQLSNTLRSAALLCRGNRVEPEDLRLPLNAGDYLPAEASVSLEMVVPAAGVQTRAEWEAKEKQAILDALVQCNWNKTRAAELLGVSRRNLYRKLARYDIEGT